ncbi:uncharacterized protein LOC131044940 isoform X2 [Cryptomeria japonica]|uniref:uncharacterized protein LOC131044940 isoform X2 n=1 Tax=Cryptomeria japonica TaxID=3369 RepID=UPI0025AC46DF|nr:uncharacterized protein LOC131044940 isoform X2 [Cryptomeria japonica]
MMAVGPPLERWFGAGRHNVYRRYSTGAPANSSTRFPIKAVIFDMPCFIQRTPSDAVSPSDSASPSDGERDSSNLIPASTSNGTSTSLCSAAVTASEVTRRLGVYNPPELQDRILTEGKARLVKKQMLEEVMGTGDSVRAKYMEQIRAKKMMAQARRERERFSIDRDTNAYTVQSTTSQKAWRVTPNSAALLLYLEVIGDDEQDESLCKVIAGSQLFVCKVRNLSYPKYVNSTQKELSDVVHSKKSNYNRGLFKWFRRLSEGTLHGDGARESGGHNSKDVHFEVTDMTGLKRIIEDMNGVSYRMSTFIQDFQ